MEGSPNSHSLASPASNTSGKQLQTSNTSNDTSVQTPNFFAEFPMCNLCMFLRIPCIPLIPLPNVPHVVDTGFDAPQARMATGFKCTIFILVSSRLCPLYSPRLPLRVRLSIGCNKTSGKHNQSFRTKKTGLGSLKTGGILPSSIRLPIESLSLDWSRPPKAS